MGEERVALRLTDRDAELRQAAEELEAMDEGFTRTRAAMERVRDGQRALSQRASDALGDEGAARLRRAPRRRRRRRRGSPSTEKR